jgi:hypothetical protein
VLIGVGGCESCWRRRGSPDLRFFLLLPMLVSLGLRW